MQTLNLIRKRSGRKRGPKPKPRPPAPLLPPALVVNIGGVLLGFDGIELTRSAVVGIRGDHRSIIATRAPDGRFLTDNLISHDTVTINAAAKPKPEPTKRQGAGAGKRWGVITRDADEPGGDE